ncbi:TetR-like C-terminal domain-containing protein [Gemmiger sp.]
MRFSNYYCFLLHGYTGMLDYWFKNGMKESPKEMESYVSKFRHDLIKNL